MNLFKNTYGKLALFYLVITVMMFYLAYDFNRRLDKIEEFYDTFSNVAEPDNAESTREPVKEVGGEAGA